MRRPLLQKINPMSWPRRFFWSGLILVLWEILLRAENPDLMSDDSGEMIAGSWALGLPHPPGYPLFDLLGHIFSWLPLGSVAFRFNLLSGVFTLGAVYWTARAVLELTEKEGLGRAGVPNWLAPGLAMSSGAVLFTNQNLFAQALSAKGVVYTLTLLLISFLAAWRVRRGPQALTQSEGVFLLFLWALGLANHWQTVILFIPFLIYWFWTSRWALSLKRAAWAVIALLLGLSPYLYLPLRAKLNPLPSWGDPVSFKGFIWVVTRQLVQGSESFFPGFIFFSHSLLKVLGDRFFESLPGFGILALTGLFFILKEKPEWGISLILLYIPVLLSVSAVRESQDIGFLLSVFLVSVSGLWVLFGFWGILKLIPRLPWRKHNRILAAFFILMGGCLGIWGWTVARNEDKSAYTLADDFGKNALKQIPREGLFIAGADQYVMPIFYDQFVLRLRPDVLFTPDIFLAHAWGWNQIARQRPAWNRQWESQNTLGKRWFWLLSTAGTRGGAYYALGNRYLAPILNQIPGEWMAAGLSGRWIPPGTRAHFSTDEILKEINGERTRGLKEGRNFSGEDFSTIEIRRYYADQFFKAARECRRVPGGGLNFWDFGLGIDSTNASACNDLAQEMDQSGNWELAVLILKQGLTGDPNSIASWFNLMGIYKKIGWDAKADFCYQRLLLLGWRGPPPAASNRLRLHPAVYYLKLSRRYEGLGFGFLTQKAFETSEILSEDPSGAAL